MKIIRPFFWIPRENMRVDSKTGGGQPPKYIGNQSEFQQHKKNRIKEIDVLIQKALVDTPPILTSPQGELFFEIEFHEKALSKSTQPRKLLEASNIDIYSQKTDNRFLASTKSENLSSFKEILNSLTLQDNKNESAYLSAITKIEPISKKDKLDENIDGEAIIDFKGFLYLADTLSIEECTQITTQVISEGNQEAKFFVSTAGSKVIYGTFNRSFIDKISEPDPRIPIYKIEKSLEFAFPQEVTVKYNYDDIEIIDPESDAIVGIVDSGISSEHRHLQNFVSATVDCIQNHEHEDRAHGTFVASRTVFGHDIESQIRVDKKLVAKTKVIDVRVMKKDIGARDVEIISAIRAVLDDSTHSGVAVFNLSVNYTNPKDVLNGKKHYFTRELDAIANKYGVIFVISAGNHNCSTVSYPNSLMEDDACITTPADSVNNISVGSIADTGSTRSVAQEGEPSPFSRSGVIGIIKPDVAHFGGNLDLFGGYAGLGVKGLSIQDTALTENVGTSFSAPIVSQIASRLYSYLKNVHDNRSDVCNLTKALVIHSAHYTPPINTRLDVDNTRRMVGFGIPDFDRAINSAESSATFIYAGSIGKSAETDEKKSKESKHRIKVIVPPELEGKDKKVKIKSTLVYTPPVSENGEVDYSLVDIELNLHRINRNGKLGSAALTKGTIDYRSKWNPVKHFEKVFTAYKGGDWEVWLTLTTRGRLDQKKYDQPYALILTIEDATTDPNGRVDIHQIIQEQYRSYLPVQVRNRVRVS